MWALFLYTAMNQKKTLSVKSSGLKLAFLWELLSDFLFSNFSANILKEALLFILVIQSLMVISLQILFQAKEMYSSSCFQYNYLWVLLFYPQACVPE